ncbi:conserved exported hypothetical protein [metagenome]|uniref:Uncharacterized protein n=1 Tax=metagenome TaxID=256318 RepID=A0A2P2BZD4_9ZZZZ
MRPVLVLAAVLLLAACGAPEEPDGPLRPAEAPAATSDAMPTSTPAAAGLVTTRWPVTVLDDGDGAELCAGGVLDSLPPQCGGPVLAGWAWSEHAGDFQRVHGVRWGEFVVTGRFDGEVFTPTEVTPVALFDPPPTDTELDPDLDPTSHPLRTGVTEVDLRRIQRELSDLPGLQSSWAENGAVAVTVLYDDGSLQKWADRTYGDGLVVVSSALVEVG